MSSLSLIYCSSIWWRRLITLLIIEQPFHKKHLNVITGTLSNFINSLIPVLYVHFNEHPHKCNVAIRHPLNVTTPKSKIKVVFGLPGYRYTYMQNKLWADVKFRKTDRSWLQIFFALNVGFDFTRLLVRKGGKGRRSFHHVATPHRC